MMSTQNTYATEFQNGYQQGLQSMGKIPIEQLYMNVRQATHKKNYQEANKFKQMAYQQQEYFEISVKEFPREVIKMTVGKNGCNFISKTEKNDIFAIWWDSYANIIEFWGGPVSNMQNAKVQILKNIDLNLDLYVNYNGLTIRDLYNQEFMMKKYPQLYQMNGDIEVIPDINGKNPLYINRKEFDEEWSMWNSHTYINDFAYDKGYRDDITFKIGGANYHTEIPTNHRISYKIQESEM